MHAALELTVESWWEETPVGDASAHVTARSRAAATRRRRGGGRRATGACASKGGDVVRPARPIRQPATFTSQLLRGLRVDSRVLAPPSLIGFETPPSLQDRTQRCSQLL